MKRDTLLSSIENSNLDVLTLINILCLDFLPFLRGEGGAAAYFSELRLIVTHRGACYQLFAWESQLWVVPRGFHLWGCLPSKVQLVTRPASLIILTAGEFNVFAIYSYPPLHLRPSSMPFFCCWRWSNQWFQKLIMRLQPIKLKYGSVGGIISVATTSAIKTSKGSVCYFITH